MNVRNLGFMVCNATHPDWPNYDGRSRGRVNHLFAADQDKFDYPATLCGMLAVGFISESQSFMQKGVCRQCSMAAERLTGQESKSKENSHER